jgi:hypothetical protein
MCSTVQRDLQRWLHYEAINGELLNLWSTLTLSNLRCRAIK